MQTKYLLRAEQSWGTPPPIFFFFFCKEFQNEIARLGKIIRTLLYFLTLILWFELFIF